MMIFGKMVALVAVIAAASAIAAGGIFYFLFLRPLSKLLS